MPIDKKISELNPASALELLIDAEIAIAPIGSTQTLKASLEAIAALIGGEKTYMADGDPLIATGRERDNYLNTETGAFFKKEVGIWVLKYQFAPGTGTGNVNQTFETLIYAASKTVTYSPLRPKKKITLAGDIAINNTGVSNGSHGIYLLIQSNSGNNQVTINGTEIFVNPGANKATVIGWMHDGANYYYSSSFNSKEHLQSLPGYLDANKTYLRKDTAGNFYWGSSDGTQVPGSGDFNPNDFNSDYNLSPVTA